MNTLHRPERGFEERLLTELKALIEAGQLGSAAEGVANPVGVPRRFGWKPRLVTVVGIAVALAVGLAVGLPVLGGDTPAYAVTQNGNDSVTVVIHEFRDAEGLQQKLREAGIPALVQYLPPGKTCKQDNLGTGPGAADPEPDLVQTMVEMRTDGSVRFTIDTSRVRPGQTLVIRTQELAPGQLPTGPDRRAGGQAPSLETAGPAPREGSPRAAGGGNAVSVGFYERDVQPCEVVDATP